MFNVKATVIAVTLAFAGSAFAQTATPGIDKRQANQEKRIDQGVKSGELNKKEAARRYEELFPPVKFSTYYRILRKPKV